MFGQKFSRRTGRCSGVTTQIVQSAETSRRPQVGVRDLHVNRDTTLDDALCDVCRVSEPSVKAIVWETPVVVVVVVASVAQR